MFYNANRGKGQAPKTGKELVPLSFDHDTDIEPLTLEEHNFIIDKFSKYLN